MTIFSLSLSLVPCCKLLITSKGKPTTKRTLIRHTASTPHHVWYLVWSWGTYQTLSRCHSL